MGSPDLERLLLQVAKQVWLNLLWMVASVAAPQQRERKTLVNTSSTFKLCESYNKGT
jgi:hypothetical protein